MLFTHERTSFKGIGSSWSMDSFYDNHLADIAACEAAELAKANEKYVKQQTLHSILID